MNLLLKKKMSVREHLVSPIWETQEGGPQETPDWGSIPKTGPPPPAAISAKLAAPT